MNRGACIHIAIRVVFTGLVHLVLSGPVLAQSSLNPEIVILELKKGLHLLTGAGGNVVVVEGDAGLALVDSGNASNSDALFTFLQQRFGNSDVSAIINTHWHLDQTGGNEYLNQMGSEIIAHENTKLWMTTDIISKWNDKVYPPRAISSLPQDTLYYGSETREFANTVVEYGYLPQGHTDGDLYVYFPEQNIMVGGGVISGGELPILDYSTGGWIGGMANSLQIILERTNEQTIFVPASGSPRSRSDLESQLLLCQTLIRAIAENYYAGETYEQFVASDPMKEIATQWSGNVEMFLHTAHEGAWGHVTELRRFR